ncbi:DNA mismatch repair protein MutS [Halobaculum rubrum]|uniref:DNA mismatch repair protein MutS n=1 Tax=Halobaculum rubrum TaxID=2872158 RepID=UPI001CA398BD|nr:DNA mismatch repair protein MutS [Halobaculum rubrum]QZX98259.1 DNA mismatch repair protein MutS [Halobaculum rubrum]
MVTGAPATMLDRREELTPMLAQYVGVAERYDDAIVLFRVGDFYKAFCEAADEVARICELTRIEREDSTGTYTACGIPVDNAPKYLKRLLDAEYRVAVADQVEDPEEASGLVDRAVTQVLTPGTVVEEELLAEGSNTYVACVASEGTEASNRTGSERDRARRDRDGERRSEGAASDATSEDDTNATYGVAHVDVSTGECAVTAGDAAAVEEELARIGPAELLCGPGVDPAVVDSADCMRTERDPETFEVDAARAVLDRYADPDRFGAAERVACGALLSYAEYTQGDDGPLGYVRRVRRYDPRRSLRLDATALRGLELFENHVGSGRTLFDTLDETRSALGRRRLRAWLRRPLVDREAIEARHDAVAAFAERTLVREDVREALSAAYDLERLAGRISRGRANARDLRSLHDTLAAVPGIRDAIAGVEALAGVRADLDPLDDLRELIDAAVVEEPPQEITEGGVIRAGYDDELDETRSTAREGREWIANLEERERERTGIDNLEVGYTQVHGYYIEVTNGQLDKVPDDYTRRQTLKNSERFYTPELKRREDEILGAEERADAMEYELFADLRDRIAEDEGERSEPSKRTASDASREHGESDRIGALADAMARVDALAALATAAVERDYVRPEMSADGISLDRSRHPVVEETAEEFVPNDADLPRGTVALITGPNMSGKSTYMRQVALAVVLAQAGSFVPADAARLPVVDRVFTRVGASDDIAGGESTFMREMRELTDVLHDATGDSLVLLDEVGRGTSTTDGRAIARAAVEFLHDETGATTLFATHYHGLTDLADEYDRVVNRHFAATERDGDITFLHRVREGAASSSYGVEVAALAGVPESVVARAHDLVAAERDGEGSTADSDPADATPQRTLDEVATNGHDTSSRPTASGSPRADPEIADLLADLRDLPLAETTPLEALNRLHELQRRAEEAGDDGNDDGTDHGDTGAGGERS